MEDSVLYVRMSNQQQLLYTPTLHCYCNYFTIGIRISGLTLLRHGHASHTVEICIRRRRTFQTSAASFDSLPVPVPVADPPTTWEVLQSRVCVCEQRGRPCTCVNICKHFSYCNGHPPQHLTIGPGIDMDTRVLRGQTLSLAVTHLHTHTEAAIDIRTNIMYLLL